THRSTQHDKVITSIDWAPNSNHIVTASQDRNAYVSRPAHGAHGLETDHTATYVRWSPHEDKFVVTSSAR
ncbi:hypothetical protein DFH11DRAFT_1468100, partial [Phellopilus nigrolimitatus]